MQGKCDHCAKSFKVKFQELSHPKGIKETYFKCPHCNQKYLCFVTDPAVRKLQKEIEKMRGKLGNAKLIEEFAKGEKEIDEKQHEVNQRMGKLKDTLA